MRVSKPSRLSLAYLIRQIPALEPQVGADVLIDSPGKLVIQFPGDEGHQDGAKSHQTGLHDQEWLDIGPECQVDHVILLQLHDGVVNLVHLDRGVHQDSDVVDAETDDLNGVLKAEGIVDQDHLVDITEHENREIRGNGLRLGELVGVWL